MAMADLIMPRLPVSQQPDVPSFYYQNQQQFYNPAPPPLLAYQPQIPIAQPSQPSSTQARAQPQQVKHQRTPSQQTPPFQTPSDSSSSLSTSNNGSPLSPKAYFTRQTRPLYMPAVLRPTDYPSLPVLSTSLPNKAVESIHEGEERRSARSSGSFIRLSQAFGLSRRLTGESLREDNPVEEFWNLDLFPEVGAPPTRHHWKPDPISAICDDPTCKRYFNTFYRRHHCRRCGYIFCSPHSSNEVPLDEKAQYNPRGTSSRACEHCYAEFKEWRNRTREEHLRVAASANEEASRETISENVTNNSAIGTGMTGSKTAPVSPVAARSMILGGAADGKDKVEVAASVPRDWNWSTF